MMNPEWPSHRRLVHHSHCGCLHMGGGSAQTVSVGVDWWYPMVLPFRCQASTIRASLPKGKAGERIPDYDRTCPAKPHWLF